MPPHTASLKMLESPDSVPPYRSKPSGVVEVFETEESPLVRFAFGMTGSRQVAEEIVQEGFLRLHREWDDVENPRAWIYRCVRNLAINELRRREKESGQPEGPERESESPLPDEVIGRHEACGMVRLLIAEMEEKDQEIVRLKYNDHMSYAQIARITGLSAGNVGYRLHHALKHLADGLRNAGIESPAG